MKQDFDKLDRLEGFRRAINYETKLYCNVDEAYDREKAADYLQRLAKSWRMAEDDVISATINNVMDTLDKQFRMYVLRFLDMLKIPYSKEQIKEQWATLSTAEKNEVIDGVIDYMQRNKRHD